MDLHTMVANMIELSADGSILAIAQYYDILPGPILRGSESTQNTVSAMITQPK